MAEYINKENLISRLFPIGMVDDGDYSINAKAVRLAIDFAETIDVYVADPKKETGQNPKDRRLWKALDSLTFVENISGMDKHTLGWKLRYGEKMFGGYINLDGCVTANDVNRLIDRIKAVVKSQEEILDHIPEDDIVPVVRCEQCRCNIENGGDCDRRVIWEDCVDPTSYTYRPLRFCSFGMKVV